MPVLTVVKGNKEGRRDQQGEVKAQGEVEQDTKLRLLVRHPGQQECVGIQRENRGETRKR
jgi:hypothetical protein